MILLISSTELTFLADMSAKRGGGNFWQFYNKDINICIHEEKNYILSPYVRSGLRGGGLNALAVFFTAPLSFHAKTITTFFFN